ncbi:hypothetical protein Vafri_2870 [Volvox africanus]|uniref:CREG-like beta-barrel domain-containing protein n=2 Tax=Volvox africanus TaxID=51714 RepID=A0A8J4AQ98_9CHLO|nr:hypothetical protein Vafri_2870 [Volvox africanus]
MATTPARVCMLSMLLLLLSHVNGGRPGRINIVRTDGVLEDVVFPRPPYEQRAIMARWLVHETSWGVLSTLDRDTGEPVGGVVSHSDGTRSSPSGRLYFYITPMDELTQNILAHPRCSYTISEQQRRGSSADNPAVGDSAGQPCGGLDPEDPACARASLLGRLEPVAEEDLQEAQVAMFSRHPRMADWPADHLFEFFELRVEEVHLLDWYGGMAIISGEDYYAAAVDDAA